MSNQSNRSPETYNNSGCAHARRGDYEQAIVDFNEAIRLNPKYAEAYYYRGLTYGRREDYEQAIVDFNEAIRLNPKLVEAYYYRGLTYGRRGNHERAIVDFNEAIRLNPNSANTYHKRGNAYSKLGFAQVWGGKNHFEKAIVNYDKAIELNPNFANAYNHRGLTHYYLGLIACQFPNASKEVDYFFRGQDYFKKAMTDYRKAIRLRVEDPKVYFNRALLWLIKKDWEKAKEDLVRARDRDFDIVHSFFISCGNNEPDVSRAIAVLECPSDIMRLLR